MNANSPNKSPDFRPSIRCGWPENVKFARSKRKIGGTRQEFRSAILGNRERDAVKILPRKRVSNAIEKMRAHIRANQIKRARLDLVIANPDRVVSGVKDGRVTIAQKRGQFGKKIAIA